MTIDAAGELDRRIRIERKNVTRDPHYGSEVVTWATLATLWANVEDQLISSRGGSETLEQGLRVRSTPVRVRVRYRSDISTDMRVVLIDRTRTLQITSIAEIGRRERTELMCEEYSA